MAEEKEMTFEAALTRLEELVRKMEAGEETLDGTLSAFEEGVTLVRFCTEKLDAAEQKIKTLTENASGVTLTDAAVTDGKNV